MTKEIFHSSVCVEEALQEIKTLIESYFEVSGEETPAILFSFDSAIQRFESVFKSHQALIHHTAFQ